VTADGSDQEDGRAAMHLCVAHARGQQLVLAAVKPQQAVASPAADIDGVLMVAACTS
jgi:hypothetical protein